MSRAMMTRASMPALIVAVAALAAGCFDDLTSPRGEQIGGTLYNFNMALPSPIRVPASSPNNTFSRVVTGTLIVDSVRMGASGLKRLTGGAGYQFYVVDGLTGAAWPVPHTARLTRTDTSFTNGVVTTSTTTSTRASERAFEGAEFNTTYQFVVRNGTGADTIGQTGNFLVLTIQADTNAPAFTATTPKMLWLQFRDHRRTAALTDDTPIAAPTARFGTFRSDNPDSSRQWTPQGNGRGAFWDQNRDGVLLLSALVFGVPQPPVGYYYQPYARDARAGGAAAFSDLREKDTDTSLALADLAPAQGTLAQLPSARFTTNEPELTCTYGVCTGPRFSDFTQIQLVLEPKAGDPSFPNITVALQGQIPGLLTVRRSDDGTVVATVTTGGAPVANASVAVYGPGTSTLIGVRATNTSGIAIIPDVPAGEVDVRAVVTAGTVTPTVQRVTVPASDTARVSFTVN